MAVLFQYHVARLLVSVSVAVVCVIEPALRVMEDSVLKVTLEISFAAVQVLSEYVL